MKKSIFIALFSVVFSTFLFAEDTAFRVIPITLLDEDTISFHISDTHTQIGGPRPSFAPQPQVNLRPQLRATLRVRGEHDLNENVNRFNIPNARVVLFGNATEWLSYQMQVDLNNHGQFRFLDMEARFREGRDFSFRVGQMLVPFGQIQQLVPRMVALCDLAWVVSRMSGSFRDIGVNATYRFRINGFPIFLTGGVYNGAGIGGVPGWTNNVAHSFRLMAGTADNIRFSLKTYHNDIHEIYGIDFRFFRNGFTIDAEFLGGNYVRSGIILGNDTLPTQTMQKIGSLLHVGKMFQTGRNTVRYIEPIVRWDMMGMANNFDFSDANRLTFGLNLGFREFNERQFFRTGELRLNYGHTFVNEARAPLYFGNNPRLWASMIMVEFLFEI